MRRIRYCRLVVDGEECQQDHHQEQANRRRRDREQGPDRIAAGVPKDISEVFHGELPVAEVTKTHSAMHVDTIKDKLVCFSETFEPF